MLGLEVCWRASHGGHSFALPKHCWCVISFAEDGAFSDVEAVNGSGMLDDASGRCLFQWGCKR
jgi:hypothetical protein